MNSDSLHLRQERACRQLEAAEYIAQMIEGTKGDHGKFCSREWFAEHLRMDHDDVDVVFNLLYWRGLLSDQRHPVSGEWHPLPAPGAGKRAAREKVADRIAFRVSLGIWNGDNFPTVVAMRGEFRCGIHTLCDALKLLESQGIVHKAFIRVAGRPYQNRDYLWRPVDVAGDDPDAFTHHLRSAILSGELTGQLPYKADTAARYNVSLADVAAAYAQLKTEGLIAKTWRTGEKKSIWYVASGDPPHGTVPGDTKTLSVARALIARTPYWLARLPDGQWARRWIPCNEALKRFYVTDVFIIEQAAELLVHLQVFERLPQARRLYVPRPPADGGQAHGLVFREHKRRKRRWEWAGEPVDWLPIPSSGDDPVVRELHDRLSLRGRRKRAAARKPLGSGDGGASTPLP